jgi:hypothetical protein
VDLSPKKLRKNLSGDALHQTLRSGFSQIPDHRDAPEISLADALMSAYAMFSLKDPSLLAFDKRRQDPTDNFRTIYGIDRVPCDSQMRSILDPTDPEHLRPLYNDLFYNLQRAKVLEQYAYFNGCYLVALDGTSYFSSKTIHCPSCMVKHHRGNTVSYSHQLLGAAIVHPDFKEVIPLMPEPIIKQDGSVKNDCERNATRRWLENFRQNHPYLKVIVIEDALSSNAPHLCDLRKAKAHFILGVKPGDHTFLFRHIREADEANRTPTLTQINPQTGILHHFRWHISLALNESNPNELVNVLEYWEVHPDGKLQHFSWVTDLRLTPETVYPIMRGGRARWKIENETFNTLKNQGYCLEHNFGHGEKNLSVVFALLMVLAFFVDQVQQLCCPLFQAALAKKQGKCYLWEQIRNYFQSFIFSNFSNLLQAIIQGIEPQQPILKDSS